MRALSIRQPYAELRRAGDQDGGAAVDVDDERDSEVRSQRSEVRRGNLTASSLTSDL
jgi:hypothetical protein